MNLFFCPSACFLSLQRPRTYSRWWSWRRRWTADLPQWSEPLRPSHKPTDTHRGAETLPSRKPCQRHCPTSTQPNLHSQTHRSPASSFVVLHVSCTFTPPPNVRPLSRCCVSMFNQGLNHWQGQVVLPHRPWNTEPKHTHTLLLYVDLNHHSCLHFIDNKSFSCWRRAHSFIGWSRYPFLFLLFVPNKVTHTAFKSRLIVTSAQMTTLWDTQQSCPEHFVYDRLSRNMGNVAVHYYKFCFYQECIKKLINNESEISCATSLLKLCQRLICFIWLFFFFTGFLNKFCLLLF